MGLSKRHIKIRYRPTVRLWYMWFIGPDGASYGLYTFRTFKGVLHAFRSGRVRNLWKAIFEDTVPQYILDLLDVVE